jgi:tight adherence protein B
MNPALTTVSTFVAAALFVAAVWSLVADLIFRDRLRINRRLREEFRGQNENQPQGAALFKDLKLLSAAVHSETGLWQRFHTMVEQSGMDMTPERLLIVSLTVGSAAGLITGLISRLWLAGLAVAAVGLVVPTLCVHWRRRIRIEKLCLQLPNAFELMSRAVRSGQTMAGAMQLVAAQSRPPIGSEFALCCEQQNLGLSQEIAMKGLARRTGVLELQMFVVAMLVQRQSGGNPVDVLNNLSDIIRKRIRLRGKVRALTGEGRMQAAVLSVLPLAALAALYFLNRPYAQFLLDRPYVLGGMLASEAVGALWIRKIIHFEY